VKDRLYCWGTYNPHDGARPLNPQWVRDLIADCRRSGVAPFHKQWGTYASNPLVVEQGVDIKDAKALDNHGKGGGLVAGELINSHCLSAEVVRG
jgi:hypothetical protein